MGDGEMGRKDSSDIPPKERTPDVQSDKSSISTRLSSSSPIDTSEPSGSDKG